MWDVIVCKPSELWIKSPSTRRRMINLLKRDFENKVGSMPEVYGPLFIIKYSEENLKNAKKIFGIKKIIPAKKINHDQIEETVLEIARREITEDKSFRITASRAWKGYEKNSMDLQRDLGAKVVKETGAKVNLKNPEVNIFVDVYKDFVLVYTKEIEGIGGLPLASEGTGIVLFSGGIDSPVACVLSGKRGIDIDALILNPDGDERHFEDAKKVFKRIKEYFPDAKLYGIDISKEIKQIKSVVAEGYRQIVFKRLMYKIADEFAKRFQYDAVITGESIGQTSSQTLKSLKILNKVVESFFVRPLSNLNKEEITELSKNFGFYEISHQIKEFCRMESHSNADPEERRVREEEAKLVVDIEEILGRVKLLLK